MRLGGGAHPTPIYNTGWIEALTKELCLPLSLTHLLHHHTPGLRAPSPHPHLMALALCPLLSLFPLPQGGWELSVDQSPP